jgi:putative tricarboxylic transport membrane protein
VIGLLLATVGTDFTTGVERFTFGFYELTEGINFVPVMIGLFSISELLNQCSHLKNPIVRIAADAVRLPSRADFRKVLPSIVRGTSIGTLIGILPAEGGTVAALVAYSQERRVSKHPEEFGKGAIEGVAGPESANNAATGGAMVPTLALGIPGSSTTAVIIGALMLHGLRPGPLLFIEQPALLYSIFFAMLAANVLFLGIGLFGARIFSRVTLIPSGYLWPCVFIFSVVGAYALNQSMFDVWVMLITGLVGYLLRRWGISAAPIVMGLVLGEMVESSLKQSLLIFDQNWIRFLERPIFDVFLILTTFGLFSSHIFGLLGRGFRRARDGRAEEAEGATE